MRTLLSIACASLLLAADFWQTKKPADWSEKEAKRLIENSPWAKEIQPDVTMGSMGGGRSGGRGGMGGPGPGPGGGGMGGGDMGGGGMQMPKVRIAFETAIPIAEAKVRMEVKDPFAAIRDKVVVISVTGMRIGGGNAARERMISTTTLKLKDDKVYQPSDIKAQQTPAGMVMLFAFDRDELKITPDDKQLMFKTMMGPMSIQVKFNLKDMVFQNQLSL